jgi:hypothetical protein
MVMPTKIFFRCLEIPELGFLTGYRGKGTSAEKEETALNVWTGRGVDMGGCGGTRRQGISNPVKLGEGECVARDRPRPSSSHVSMRNHNP